ncbi:MAG TPA: prolyl oligopeptidase family serine peptidase [Solirubrobacterales bacterium]|nr:prolyl oligopeptidase family serine peptidase [Solirubrobacterales bacterium]
MPELVSFPSGNLTLRGFLTRPDGRGPFPAVSWNHGSERQPGSRTSLADFYASSGFVFLEPHRRGHGESPGEHFADGVEARARSETDDPAAFRRRVVELVIELHELQLRDTIAAVDWLRNQPFVDRGGVVVSGASYGGIQTMLAAEADAGAHAYVPFAPAAMAWDSSPALRERLERAVSEAAAPMFLLQAENDYSLGPSEVLGAMLRRKGPPSRSQIYPAFGGTPQDGHSGFACEGMGVWGADVRRFLNEVLTA